MALNSVSVVAHSFRLGHMRVNWPMVSDVGPRPPATTGDGKGERPVLWGDGNE